jgi:hypothetical protein
MLFAETHPEALIIVIPCVLGIIGYAIFYVWLAVNRPEIYREHVRQWHEEEMEDKRAKAEAAARRNARNQQGLGILGRLFKGFFR